jgi:hypothetical protein
MPPQRLGTSLSYPRVRLGVRTVGCPHTLRRQEWGPARGIEAERTPRVSEKLFRNSHSYSGPGDAEKISDCCVTPFALLARLPLSAPRGHLTLSRIALRRGEGPRIVTVSSDLRLGHQASQPLPGSTRPRSVTRPGPIMLMAARPLKGSRAGSSTMVSRTMAQGPGPAEAARSSPRWNARHRRCHGQDRHWRQWAIRVIVRIPLRSQYQRHLRSPYVGGREVRQSAWPG